MERRNSLGGYHVTHQSMIASVILGLIAVGGLFGTFKNGELDAITVRDMLDFLHFSCKHILCAGELAILINSLTLWKASPCILTCFIHLIEPFLLKRAEFPEKRCRLAFGRNLQTLAILTSGKQIYKGVCTRWIGEGVAANDSQNKIFFGSEAHYNALII